MGVTPLEKGKKTMGRRSWTVLWSQQNPQLAPWGALILGWPLRIVMIWGKGFEPFYPCKEQSLLPRAKDMTWGKAALRSQRQLLERTDS